MTQQSPETGVVSAHSDAEGIRIVRVFDAPRELVYAAWTEPHRFATWFGEHGSSIPLDRVAMDVRPGGAWNATMLVPHEGQTIEIGFHGTFVEVDPPARVAMTITDVEDGTDQDVLTAIFRDLGDGRTEMTFTQTGGNLPADEYSRALRGELIFFDRLAEHLEAARA
jgi:uncharacterized protein YndB with AHSA1/START domain